MQLAQRPAQQLVNGRIELQQLRGTRMGMIYQSPRSALNPIRAVALKSRGSLSWPKTAVNRKNVRICAMNFVESGLTPSRASRIAAPPLPQESVDT